MGDTSSCALQLK